MQLSYLNVFCFIVYAAFGIYGLFIIYGKNKAGLKASLSPGGWQIVSFTVWLRLIPALAICIFLLVAFIFVILFLLGSRRADNIQLQNQISRLPLVTSFLQDRAR